MWISWQVTLRRLRQTAGFTTIAVLTLMLAAGTNTAMFTIINALMFRPLPFPEPQRLALRRDLSGSVRQCATSSNGG